MLIILSVVFHKNTINEFPSHIHAWSQADRYALSLGFLNNGFDFFHPQTYNLNVQFPASKTLAVEEGITAVDFPIHEFIIAVLMKLLHTTEPLGIQNLQPYLCTDWVVISIQALQFTYCEKQLA